MRRCARSLCFILFFRLRLADIPRRVRALAAGSGTIARHDSGGTIGKHETARVGNRLVHHHQEQVAATSNWSMEASGARPGPLRFEGAPAGKGRHLKGTRSERWEARARPTTWMHENIQEQARRRCYTCTWPGQDERAAARYAVPITGGCGGMKGVEAVGGQWKGLCVGGKPSPAYDRGATPRRTGLPAGGERKRTKSWRAAGECK